MTQNLASLGRLAHRRAVLNESLALAAICTADMISTLYWVRHGIATESNPLMAVPLARSDAAFLGVKLASYLVPIAILELLRPVRPEFVARALRACVVGYVALYALGSLALRIVG